MYFKKEKVEDIIPIKDTVKLKVLIPKEIKTASGIILPNAQQIQKHFDGIQTYNAEVLEIPESAREMFKDKLEVGDIVVFDKLGGYGAPTIGEDYIKLVSISALLMKKENVKDSIATATALGERVIIRLDKAQEQTESGIYVPQNASLASNVDSDVAPGELLSVAEGVPVVKVGDRVLFDTFSGIEFKEEGEIYKIMSMHELIAKLNN